MEHIEFCIEITRHGDVLPSIAGEQAYAIRIGSPEKLGKPEDALFSWSEDWKSYIEALQCGQDDPDKRSRKGHEIETFLRSHSKWSEVEKLICTIEQSGQLVVLTFRFAAEELFSLPWEFCTLEESGGHLGKLPHVLLRFEFLPTHSTPEKPYPRPEGGRILFAWSTGLSDRNTVPWKPHLDTFTELAKEGHFDFDSKRDVLGEVEWTELRNTLEKAADPEETPISVLYLLCHGGAKSESSASYGLVLHDKKLPVIFEADKVADLLGNHAARVRLVVIAACNSANSGKLGNAIGSVALRIHRAGIPSVVGAQFFLTPNGAIEFNRAFVEALLVKLQSVENAFVAGRKKLIGSPELLDWAAMTFHARSEDGYDSRPLIVRPYRGLEAFKAEHKRFFRGREKETEEAVEDFSKLVDARDKPRILLMTGASGSGKSSLVFAGVVPALQEKYKYEVSTGTPGLAKKKTGYRWRLIDTRPGQALAAIEAVLAAPRAEKEILVVVDQFEEIFTHLDETQRAALVQRLWELAVDPASNVSVIVTLRVDFLGQCGGVRLGETNLERLAYDEAHRVFVPRMSEAELRGAIVEPAEMVGLRVDSAVVGDILRHTGTEPGALPLVEYTLDQLWLQRERREGREVLTWETYQRLGGIEKTLNDQANAAFNAVATLKDDKLGDLRKQTAQRILVNLVHQGDDTQLATRKRMSKEQLRVLPGVTGDVFDEVLEKLTSSRLLVIGGDKDARDEERIVEIAHEQLVRSWEQLKQWRKDEVVVEKQLKPFRNWMAAKVATLTGDDLALARTLKKSHAAYLGRAEIELVERSEMAERKRKRLARLGVAGIGVTAVVMGVLAVMALRYAGRARDNALLSRGADLRTRGAAISASKLLLEVKSVGETNGWSDNASSVLNSSLPIFSIRHPRRILQARWSPDGTRIATTSDDYIIRIWNENATGMPIELKGHANAIGSFEWSHDSRSIVSTSGEQTALVWLIDKPDNPRKLEGHSEAVTFAAWSYDDQRIVTASDDKTARVWKVNGTNESVKIGPFKKAVKLAVWSHDDQRIMTVEEKMSVPRNSPILAMVGPANSNNASESDPEEAERPHLLRVWNADGTGEPIVFEGHEGGVKSAAWSPNDQHIFSVGSGYLGFCGGDKTVRVWSSDGGSPALILNDGDKPIAANGAAWSPDGIHIVAACEDGKSRVWDTYHPERPKAVLTGHTDFVESAQWDSMGRRIVTASRDRTIRVYDGNPVKESKAEMVLQGHEAYINDAFWHPDGIRILSTAWDNVARVWYADGSTYPRMLPRSPQMVFDAAWSPDGQRIATLPFGKGALRIFDANQTQAPPIEIKQNGASQLAWSPDSRQIVVRSSNGLTIWPVNPMAPEIPISLPEANSLTSVSWCGSGKYIVTTAGKMVFVWSVDNRALLHQWPAGDKLIRKAACHSASGRVVLATEDNVVSIGNIDGTGLRRIGEHQSSISEVAWSPDGTYVATASSDKTASIWNIAQTPEKPSKTFVHNGVVSRVAWSPDGMLLATAFHDNSERSAPTCSGTNTQDRKIRIWNIEREDAPIATLDGHEVNVSALDWSPDGVYLLSASGDKTARVWPVTPNALQRALQDANSDCLLPAERINYLDEQEPDARSRYEACEKKQNRIPWFTRMNP